MVGVVVECPSSGHKIRCASDGLHDKEAIMQNGCGWAAWRRARLIYCTNTDETHDDPKQMKVERSKSEQVVRKTNEREMWTMISIPKMFTLWIFLLDSLRRRMSLALHAGSL